MKLMKPFSAAMLLMGAACLAAAIIWGHESAYPAAAMCFCASGTLLLQARRQRPPEED